MMSWAVPQRGGGARVYVKGAAEIILNRVVAVVDGKSEDLSASPMNEELRGKIENEIIGSFAAKAMRTIGLAYRDLESLPGDEVDEAIANSDGTAAFAMETQLILVGV